MKKHGKILLSCNCSFPHGTPLLVSHGKRLGIDEIKIGGQCLLDRLEISADGLKFTGNCPSCRKFAYIHLKSIIGYPSEDDGILQLLAALESPSSNRIAFLSPHLRLGADSPERFNRHETRHDLPSPDGLQSLHIDTFAKWNFADDLIQRAKNTPHEFLPTWYQSGTDEEFEQWTKQIGYFDVWVACLLTNGDPARLFQSIEDFMMWMEKHDERLFLIAHQYKLHTS